jgi:hypothetical protein
LHEKKNQVTVELIKHISFDPRVIIHNILSAAIYKERSQVFLSKSMKPSILAFFGQVWFVRPLNLLLVQ